MNGSRNYANNKGSEIRINWLKLSEKLRMYKYIKSNRWKSVQENLKKCYELGLSSGWLIGYESNIGKEDSIEVFSINQAKFIRGKNSS